MTRYFADTFYYLALLNERDDAHPQAVELNARLRGGIVTTQWVLTEVGDALADPQSRPLFLELLEILKSDTATTIVEAEPELCERGVALFAERPDKDWSLTDCISFTVMLDLQVAEALTGDHHFEQAGFSALLK